MGPVRGSLGCVVLGGLAALLYAAGLANPERDFKAALARLDARATIAPARAALVVPDLRAVLSHSDAAIAAPDLKAALSHSDAALAGPDLSAARHDPDASDVLADPVEQVALATPEIDASSLKASDECLLAQDCVDQYLWSVYERARKVDTIK